MLTAKDIMTKEVITVTPDLSVKDLADLMWRRRISGVPVLDEEGILISVVTQSDLIDQTKKIHIPKMIAILDSVLYLEKPGKMEEEIKKMTGATVRDIMSKELISVTEKQPLDEIASIMADKKVHTLPVLSGNHLVGVIGKSDIIRSLLT